MEPVAPASDGVRVDVDRPAILEEALAAASSSSSSGNPAPSSALELGAPSVVDAVQAKAADAAPAVRMLVASVCGTFAPNWEIEKAEGDAVADSAALVMAYWMPDGALDPKYVSILALAGALYGVAASRRAADGSWRPLRKPLEERAPATGAPIPPAPAGGAPGSTPLRLV